MCGCRRELCCVSEQAAKNPGTNKSRIRLVGWILFFVATKRNADMESGET
jgi:hypothetical protein